MLKFFCIYTLLSLTLENIYCKSCSNLCSTTCETHKLSCLNVIKNSTCTNYDENCNCNIYKDKYNQLMDCSYHTIIVNLTKDPKPVELFCKDENMNIIVSSAWYTSSNRTKHDVTNEMRQLCALKSVCAYPIHLEGKCDESNRCFDEFAIEYFCKDTKIEQSNCDKYCFNGAKCKECHTEFLDPTVSKCVLCQCIKEPQLIMPNRIENRFCNITIHKKEFSSATVITGVVFLIILSSAGFALIFIGILYFVRRRTYKNYSHERLLSFPLETELI